MDSDKLVELHRYDVRAQSQLSTERVASAAEALGSSAMPHYLRAPYIFYEKSVRELIGPQDSVLELGSGAGLHTWVLVNTGAQVTATDISPNSLKLLEQRMGDIGKQVKTQVADIESLPFENASFDVIACAGSLSYGDVTLVDAEIKRVLRPGGLLLCVDSLNHNPIYRLNRWFHYRRGDRTKSTLQRMPNIARIQALGRGFASTNIYYFGALSFVMPIVAWILGGRRAGLISDYFDRAMKIKRSAFKFVLIAEQFNNKLP